MTLLMEILKIYVEEQLVMKCNPIKHLILVEIPKYDWYQHGLDSMAYKYFHKNFAVTWTNKYTTYKQTLTNSEN